MQSASPDFAQLKSNLKASWMAGDFGQIANYAVKVGEDFVARTEIKPGARVLDVACGTGNTAIPAARAGGLVTGVDIAPNLLEQARKRAVAEQLEIRFDDRWRNENRSRVSGCQSDPWLGSPQSSWLAMARRRAEVKARQAGGESSRNVTAPHNGVQWHKRCSRSEQVCDCRKFSRSPYGHEFPDGGVLRTGWVGRPRRTR